MKNKFLNISILIVFVLIFFSCSKKEFPKAENGIINISNWNFEQNGHVNLNGQWEFYFNQLLTPSDFEDSNAVFTGFIKVPKNWNKYKIDNKPIGSHGFATYRLKVITNSTDTIYTLKLRRIDVAYKLWINGKLITEIGRVADNKQDIIPDWKSYTINIDAKADTLEFVLQIANFNHNKGGFNKAISIGPPNQIQRFHNSRNYFDFFLLGLMIIMGLYHFGLYFLRKNEFTTLFFAVLSFAVALHLSVVEEFVIRFINPNIGWQWIVKFDFLGNYLRITFFALFLGSLFRKQISKYFVYGLTVICIIMGALILFTPPNIFTKTFTFFSIILVFSILYLVVGIFRATLKKEKAAILSLIGTMSAVVAVFNDVAYANNLIESTYLVPYGLLVFIFLQALMISARFYYSFKKVELLSDQLEESNITLELKVVERTNEIETKKIELENSLIEIKFAKKRIEETNEELMQQQEEMRVQSEILQDANIELEKQKEELKIQAENLETANTKLEKSMKIVDVQNKRIKFQHKNITDSIKYAQRIQEAILPPLEQFRNTFSDYFIFFKPRDIVSGDFYFLESVNEKTYIAVADCTGHGVPGGFMSMLSFTLILEIIRTHPEFNAAQVLFKLKQNIIDALKQDDSKKALNDGLDVAFCIIDKEFKTINFAGAYNPVLYIDKNKPELLEFKGDKMPIGSYFGQSKPFTNIEIPIKKGDIFYLFSDGFKDQYGGEENRKFLYKSFKDLIFQNHSLPMQNQKEELDKTLDNWIYKNLHNCNQLDDILVMGIKI